MPKDPNDQQEVVMSDISNRQIVIDSIISVLMFLAVSIPLAAFLWWVTDFLSIPHRFRSGIVGLAGVGAFLILKIVKRRRHVQKT